MSFEGSARRCSVHAQTRLEASTSRVGALFGVCRDRRLFLFIVIGLFILRKELVYVLVMPQTSFYAPYTVGLWTSSRGTIYR